ncbi:MAG: ABC transporter permease [Solobacterium sp.]|nr:ABC transporter permease [Solobacterium sp.]
MSLKKRAVQLCLLAVFGLMLGGIWKADTDTSDQLLRFAFTMHSDHDSIVRAYYAEGEEPVFSEQRSSAAACKADAEETLKFDIPANSSVIRVVVSDQPADVKLSDFSLAFHDTLFDMSGYSFSAPEDTEHVERMETENQQLHVVTGQHEGTLVYRMDPVLQADTVKKALAPFTAALKWFGTAVVLLIAVISFRKFNALIEIPCEVIANRKLVLTLARNDFRTRYSGSVLGTVWAFIPPVVTVLLYWFVFEKALHAGSQAARSGISVPFVFWLIAGLVPWFYFQEVMVTASNALLEYNYLVKKVVFHISILPMVKVVSSVFVHLFFVAAAIVVGCIFGFYPGWHTLQLLYYFLCMAAFVTGFSYFSSAIVVFFRDFTHLISIVMQVLVWVTPIMWNIDSGAFPPILVRILKLNPVFYIVNGYRDALITRRWFFEMPGLTVYFWTVVFLTCGFGFLIFRRLRPHFADIL